MLQIVGLSFRQYDFRTDRKLVIDMNTCHAHVEAPA